MQRHLRILNALLIVALAIGSSMTRPNQTIATLQKMPKPQSYPFDEARKIAEANLPKFMRSIGSQYKSYGFKSIAETMHATLGTPYLAYGFDLLNVPDRTPLQGNIRDYLEGGTDIGFPILVDGDARAYMSVIFRNSTWQDGEWSSYSPRLIVNLQKQLVTQGITERVDLLGFGFEESLFGMIDLNGRTMLIPLADTGKHFPELDFSGDRMYTLDEVLPLVRVQAQHSVEEIMRQNLEMQR